MDNEKLYELITKMYAEMQNGFKHVDERFTSVDERFTSVDERFDSIEGEIKSVKETVCKIEVEHGQKLSALFDGYNQNAQKLDRIEAEVKKHDEFILTRIK
jgi:predicted nuclease with TOPRIM domain